MTGRWLVDVTHCAEDDRPIHAAGWRRYSVAADTAAEAELVACQMAYRHGHAVSSIIIDWPTEQDPAMTAALVPVPPADRALALHRYRTHLALPRVMETLAEFGRNVAEAFRQMGEALAKWAQGVREVFRRWFPVRPHRALRRRGHSAQRVIATFLRTARHTWRDDPDRQRASAMRAAYRRRRR